LFFDCTFSQRICNYLQIKWESGDDMLQVAINAKESFRKPFFSEVTFIACWQIWKLRNGKIFRNERAKFTAWRSNFIHDISLHIHRFSKKMADVVEVWLDNLP
jgi:hypothetical protein